MEILTRAEKKTFKRLCERLNIKDQQQIRIEKFNEWMLKMGNIHYSDNQQMLNAYNKIL